MNRDRTISMTGKIRSLDLSMKTEIIWNTALILCASRNSRNNQLVVFPAGDGFDSPGGAFSGEKNMGEPSLHDWEYEHDSRLAFDREVAREVEIKYSVKDRIDDLMLASGHGKDEQALMEKVLSTLAESQTTYGTVKKYLFEIWQLRDAQTDDEKRKRDRAAQVIANLIAPVLRDIVTSDVSRSFEH